MEQTSQHFIRLFNTPVEVGLRALILLNASAQNDIMLDAEKIMYLDYLCLNTSDLGGPESINAPIPNRGIQVYSKKDLIQKGLLVLISKELISLRSTSQGFMYVINEAGKTFLSLFTTKYYADLVARAEWVWGNWGQMTNQEIGNYIDRNIQKWGGEFLTSESNDLI